MISVYTTKEKFLIKFIPLVYYSTSLTINVQKQFPWSSMCIYIFLMCGSKSSTVWRLSVPIFYGYAHALACMYCFHPTIGNKVVTIVTRFDESWWPAPNSNVLLALHGCMYSHDHHRSMSICPGWIIGVATSMFQLDFFINWLDICFPCSFPHVLWICDARARATVSLLHQSRWTIYIYTLLPPPVHGFCKYICI
jgi:hypothetical protein